MATTVRANQARLLAESRGIEPRARLAQAVSRADFLLRLSRTVSAIQSPERALEAAVGLLLEEMVDLAQVVVRTGPWQLSCGGVHGLAPHSRVDRWTGDGDALSRAIAEALPVDVVLPRHPEPRVATLSAHLVDDALVAEATGLPIEHLLLLPLYARGRTFGVLLIGRALGFGDVATFLEDLSARIAVGLDAALLLAESRHVAAVLRDSLAPAELPEIAHLDVATYVRVAHQSEALGGDLVDIHGPDDDLLLVCGDVAGKGVEAAVHAKRIRNAVRTGAHVDRRPGWMLGLVNRVLCAEADEFSESLATLVCARLRTGADDATSGSHGLLTVDLASAGHPPALVLRSDGSVEEVATGGPSLALLPDATYEQSTLTLAARDTLLLYTDGVTEARGAADIFGDERLRRILRRLAGLRASSIAEALAVEVSEHIADRAHDDIALLVAQYDPEGTVTTTR